MKASIYRRLCSFLLIASLLLQTAPIVQAQSGSVPASMSTLRGELLEAQRILAESSEAKSVSTALPPLDRAKRLVYDRAFTRSQPRLAANLQEGIGKARLKVLWNDGREALSIVNRLLGQVGKVDTMLPKSQPQQKAGAPAPCPKPTPCPPPTTPVGNTPGAGTALGVTLVAGFGAVLAALLLGFGQVSHR